MCEPIITPNIKWEKTKLLESLKSHKYGHRLVFKIDHLQNKVILYSGEWANWAIIIRAKELGS